MRDVIVLPFGVESDRPRHWYIDKSTCPKGKGRFGFFLDHRGVSGLLVNGIFEFIRKRICIRLVHEKFTIFPFRKDINENVAYSSFLGYTFYEI